MKLCVRFEQTDQRLSAGFQDNSQTLGAEFKDVQTVTKGGPDFKPDGETLILEDGVLRVNTADEVGDSTLPITAAAVNVTVGNIEVLLGTI